MLALSTLLVVVGSCRPKTDSAVKLTYAMPTTVAAIPAYVALDRGFFEAEGLLVEAKMFSSGRLALDALLAKSAEVMSVSETPLVHAILAGHKVAIVATVTEHSEAKAIARGDRGIVSPGDLRGKRVATLPGTNSDYFLYALFESIGLRPEDVRIISMQPPEMVTAFVKGDIDAYFAWEPHVYFAKKRVSGAVVFESSSLYRGRHCVTMNQDYVRAHPEVVEKLVRAFLRAEAFVAANPDEAMGVVARRANMDLEAVKSLWRDYEVRTRLDDELIEMMAKEARWASKGRGKVAPEFGGFVDSRALAKERPDAVRLKP